MCVSALQIFKVTAGDAGMRLDRFLTAKLDSVSRARVQELIEQAKIRVDGEGAKPSLKLRGGEEIEVLGPAERPPLRAVPEPIPVDVLYEDEDLAVVNKPAGMTVHAGAGATDDARNRGTLVNALLHRFSRLSSTNGNLRPGIVHRLDKETSGLIIVAKNDSAHHRLARQFADRKVKKIYVALVHGWLKQDSGTVKAAIGRDPVRRARMTTRTRRGREAVTHYRVRERIASTHGKFSLLEVKIDTGRTHQIRVHMASLGHPVVGDGLYGAPREAIARGTRTKVHGRVGMAGDVRRKAEATSLSRNFLHAAAVQFVHPRTGKEMSFAAPMPAELRAFLLRIRPK